MSDATPTLSIVIPAYNYGRFLPKAIASALEQAFTDIEVIVVDDCSTDDTPERVEPFLADRRVRYLRNEHNLGAVRNVNKAFAEARGEFTMLLGADDFLLPGCLDRLHDALCRHPEAGFAFGNYVIANDDDRIVATIRHPGHFPCDLPPGRDNFPDLLARDDYIYMGVTVFRTAVLREYGTFDPELTIDETPGRFFRATDWDLVLRLSLRGVQSIFLYAPLAAFRVHGNQASLGQDFDHQGIAAREAAALLDRYLTPANRSRLAGHESGILTMIAGKRAHYTQFSQPGMNGDTQKVLESFERAERFLHELVQDPCDDMLEQPTVSVVLTQLDDAEGLQAGLQTLKAQGFADWEAVVINRGRLHLGNLCEDKELAGRVRYIHLPGASLPEARNIGAHLARGPLLHFLEPGTNLPAEYFASLASELSSAGCVAVQCPMETYEPAECGGLYGAWNTLLRLILPAGHPWSADMPPLAAFAMRRHVFLRLGGFDTALPLLAELDLILRLEKGYPVHQLAVAPGASVPSLVATLYRQNAELRNDNALEQTLQALVRRFAVG